MIAGESIETEDIREALFPVKHGEKDDKNILNRNLGNGFSLPDLIAEVVTHYLKRSDFESRGNKIIIASLLGLPNYQTASNWLKRYGIGE